MGLTGRRTYVGFGFGAIQAGLFLYEAFQSAAFGRLVVVEVMPGVVQTVRQAQGFFSLNIAHADWVQQAAVGPVEIFYPALDPDRDQIIAAIAAAEEIGTAIPSVAYYATGGPDSLHRLLAEGLRQKARQNGPRAVVYTAENHNHAAEILESKVLAEIAARERPAVQDRVRFLNTVIGKMSGVITDPAEIGRQVLATITPGPGGLERAFLVESFNRILISKIRFEPPFERGLAVFEEKEELLPFEEAKLYGHNATHALAAYIAAMKDLTHIAELRAYPELMAFLRAAFIEESGQALIKKYARQDPLFTSEGYRWYANDLLLRMTNPHLRDTVERVGRDPQRKLDWDDRLIGVIRLALSQGVTPRRYALGVAAALISLDRAMLDSDELLDKTLVSIWAGAAPNPAEQAGVLALIKEARPRLKRWLASGDLDLEGFSVQSDFMGLTS
ncbi:MAG: hypothetical protein AB1801_16820 [Chloroflexota bacterium]